MARKKRLGILTGGGDVPGLNPAIKAVVTRAFEEDWEAIGIRRGWGGLLHCDPADAGACDQLFLPLTRNVVRSSDRSGGTCWQTSRSCRRRG